MRLTLLRGVDPQAVIKPLDRLLAPYGGQGAYPRADQLSHYFLDQEIQQLAVIARILPVIFLDVLERSETVVDPGRPLLEIGDPEALEIVVDVLTRDAVRIEAGARATVEGWGGPPLEAVVRRVEPTGFTKVSALGVEEQRVNVVLDPAPPLAGWSRLGHGYRVDVRITIFAAEAVPRVPLSALFRDGDRWVVFVAADGRAALRHIEIDARDRSHAMVTAGLAPGEQVVLYPSERLADGTLLVERDGR